MVPHIELIPHYGELHDGRPDYSIWAGEMQVGSIYQAIMAGNRRAWLWSVAGLVNDNRNGVVMGGASDDLDGAKRRFRAAFDGWMAWALSQPESHLSFGTIDKHLRRIGAR